MSLLIVGIDVTIVNVALPSIGHSLHASLSDLQWTVDAYTLVLGSLLMASGSAADRFGRRRVFQIGLVLFTLGIAAVQRVDQRHRARHLPLPAGARRFDAQPGRAVDRE